MKFARAFKPGEVETYGMELSFGTSTRVNCDIEYKVVSITRDGASVHLKMAQVKMPTGMSPDTAPEITRSFGPMNLPADIKFGTGNQDEGYIFLLVAGITTNQEVVAGQSLSVSWQNDAKSLKISGKGQIKSIDSSTHKMTVDWVLTMTPAADTAGQFKLTSVYSTDNFSLIRTDGSIGFSGQSISVHINRR